MLQKADQYTQPSETVYVYVLCLFSTEPSVAIWAAYLSVLVIELYLYSL